MILLLGTRHFLFWWSASMVPFFVFYFFLHLFLLLKLLKFLNKLLFLAEKFSAAINCCQNLLFHESTMFSMLIVLFFKTVKFSSLVLALEIHISTFLSHVVSLNCFFNYRITKYTQSSLNIRFSLKTLIVWLKRMQFLVEFLNNFLFMCINLSMHNLLCQCINLFVDLLEVTVNLIFANNVMVERLFLRSVPEFLIIKHELLSFGLMNNWSSRCIFLVYNWHVTGRWLVHNISVFVEVWDIFKHGVWVFVVAPEESISIFSKVPSSTFSFKVDVPERLMLSV